jgi:radical SAM enzyme (TIGR01210 family)
MSSLEDFIPDRRISSKGDANAYVSCWTEKDVLDDEVVDALVVILRTKGCSWARKKGCTMCGYFNDCNPQVEGDNLVIQMTKALENADGHRILKIFTSGSFLDDREVPPDTRGELLKAASDRFEMAIFETRPEYVTRESIEDCISSFGRIQVALGLESANDTVLKHSINKGFLFDDYTGAAYTIKNSGASVKTYLLIKPPFLTELESIKDCVESARKTKDTTDVISFNPVNVQRGTLVERLWRRDEYRPPWLWSLVRILEECKDLGPRVASFPTGGGKKRGAHNCYECDADVLKEIEAFSMGSADGFGQTRCRCFDTWLDLLDTQGFTQSSIDIERYYK